MARVKLEALHAMVDWLPRDHMEWTTDRRREFLETFTIILDFVHPVEVTPVPADTVRAPCDGERRDQASVA